jgi:hypothetical protein
MQLTQSLSLAACLSFMLALPTWAADVQRQHVEQSVQLTAPVDQVWAVVGKFDGLHEWHPSVKSTIMKNPLTRVLDLGEGRLLTEELETKSDANMSLSYRISQMSTVETIQVEGKPVEKKVLPINTYSSTLSVKPAGTGSQVIWSGDFHPAWLGAGTPPVGMSNQDAINVITNVYQVGLNNLLKSLNSTAAAPAPAAPAPAPAAPAPAAPAPAPAPAAPAPAPAAPAPAAPAPAAPAPAAPAPAAATATPTTVAVTPAAGNPYEGHVKCEGSNCKVDTFIIKGFRTFGQCQVCHGMDGGGSTIAPSLLVKLKELDHNTFINRVTNGYKGQIGVMPPWKDNPNIMNNIENLYAYLKARSDGVIPAGNLERF